MTHLPAYLRQIILAPVPLALFITGCTPVEPEAIQPSLIAPSPIAQPTRTTTAPAERTPTAAPLAECLDQAGTIETGTYGGTALPQEIPYIVYLPPCYGDAQEPYPTLYLLHGYPYDEAHWQSLGAFEAADLGMTDADWPPFIMVLPLQPEPLYRGSDGGPGSYETEFLEGLVPFIEQNFHSDPLARSLAGISRGGVWALEIGLRNPAKFVSVAALSPALAVNSARAPYDPFEIVATSDRFPRSMLLLAGDEDWAEVETDRLSRLLTAAGVEHTFQIVAGDHSDTTWAAVMSDVLGFLAYSSGT